MGRRHTRPHRNGAKNNYWAQEAVEKKGAYTKSVERRYGDEGFTQDGRIKQSVINADKKSPNLKTKRRAVLADNLRHLPHYPKNTRAKARKYSKETYDRIARIG